MRKTFVTALTLAGAVLSPLAWSAPAATLLFTQTGTQIVSENGAARPAKRGDVMQTGERLRTPPGAISQLLLPDGSLIGMRPDSELKIDLPAVVTDNSRQVVSLLQGAAHVIGAELMDAKRTTAFTFQSGLATLRLQGADVESAIVKTDLGKPTGLANPGSYNRLLVGTGSIGSGTLVEPLAPRQVSFVGAINVAPITVASVSPNLFSAPLPTPSTLPTLSTTTVGTTTPAITAVSPINSSVLIQPIAPVSISPTTLAVAPVLSIAPTVTIKPILTTPIIPISTTKLPLLSCKVLKTC